MLGEGGLERPGGAGRGLSHVDERGNARMVDVGEKQPSERVACAEAFVEMSEVTLSLITEGNVAKGDALGVARIAGIQAAKRTWELVPLCHQVSLTSVEVDLVPDRDGVRITATARALDRTGVEMEALTAVSVAALTLYDMCKAAERGITIRDVRLISKSGGRSGEWTRGEGDG